MLTCFSDAVKRSLPRRELRQGAGALAAPGVDPAGTGEACLARHSMICFFPELRRQPRQSGGYNMRKILLWCSFLVREAGLAARRLARQPTFWGPVVLTLALGFAATGAVFTLLYAVVLNPLPYPASGELVRLQTAVPGMGADA